MIMRMCVFHNQLLSGVPRKILITAKNYEPALYLSKEKWNAVAPVLPPASSSLRLTVYLSISSHFFLFFCPPGLIYA
jgi:hypothetical protein